jgi:hypothetical protein
MRAILLLLAALLGSPAEPANIATGAIKRFGVASVIADKFTRSYIGFSAFTNKVEEIDVTSWGIDAAYAEQLGKVAAVLSAQYVAAPTTPHLDVQTARPDGKCSALSERRRDSRQLPRGTAAWRASSR